MLQTISLNVGLYTVVQQRQQKAKARVTSQKAVRSQVVHHIKMYRPLWWSEIVLLCNHHQQVIQMIQAIRKMMFQWSPCTLSRFQRKKSMKSVQRSSGPSLWETRLFIMYSCILNKKARTSIASCSGGKGWRILFNPSLWLS